MNDVATLAEAREAVGDVLPRLTALLRRVAASPRPAIGHWSVPDVACHLSHAVELDTTALLGGPIPEVEPTPSGTATWTASMLHDDPERDLDELADRIEERGACFLEARPHAESLDWLGGVELAPATVACHLLAELLIHGRDIAQATRSPWPIQAPHAALAVVGGGAPIINACPDLFLNASVDPGRRARVELRLRGHDRLTLVLDRGLRVEVPPARPADAYLSTPAEDALLIFFGRRSPWRVAASGRALVWGRRPQALLTMLNAIASP